MNRKRKEALPRGRHRQILPTKFQTNAHQSLIVHMKRGGLTDIYIIQIERPTSLAIVDLLKALLTRHKLTWIQPRLKLSRV